MSARLLCEAALTDRVQIPAGTLGADYTRQSLVALNANTLAFSSNDYLDTDPDADFIVKAKEVELDAAADTYNLFDAVYDANPGPTGIVNKTPGAGRQIVGYVIKPVTLAAQGKIKVAYRGDGGTY